MRWLGFAICAVVVLTLQTTVAWRLEIGGARPDWMLVLAVFFVLHARTMDALIGAWVLGAALDVMTRERFGVFSLSYAISTVGVYAVREYVFRDHPATHFLATFAAAVVALLFQAVYRSAAVGTAGPGVVIGGLGILTGALYTAAWAPPLQYVLLRFSGSLGLRPARRRRGRRKLS